MFLVYFNTNNKKLNNFNWYLSLFNIRRAFYKTLFFKGLGYRLYKNFKIVIIKASYTRLLAIKLLSTVICSIKKKRWTIRFGCSSKRVLYRTARMVQNLYPLNAYKFIGFRFRTKKKFKIGKKARY